MEAKKTTVKVEDASKDREKPYLIAEADLPKEIQKRLKRLRSKNTD
jgi:hypothetical protein